MQKIVPHLWFDKEAKEATELYTSTFPNSKILSTTTIKNTPSRDTDIASFELCGQAFMAISAGPYFKFNPSISFHVKCKTKDEVDKIWGKFSDGGKVLMELGEYPWSEKYGWVQDKYGVSWQIIFVGESEMNKFFPSEIKQKITPVIMFVGNVCGKTEEAINFYTKVFKNAPFDSAQGESKVDNIMRYGKIEEPDKAGSVKYASFTLAGQEFGAMDSAHEHKFAFNEAISFIVNCETQEEIDYFWEALSAVPESEQCGWLKDKYGLSWQIVPTIMGEMMGKGTPKQLARVTEAFLKMKKFDIAELERAYREK